MCGILFYVSQENGRCRQRQIITDLQQNPLEKLITNKQNSLPGKSKSAKNPSPNEIGEGFVLFVKLRI